MAAGSRDFKSVACQIFKRGKNYKEGKTNGI